MRILLLNQFFWPDASATSQLLTDLARGLAARGHEVHAICADGGYAIQDATDHPGVSIHRIKAVRFGRGPLGRIASYTSFFTGCIWQGFRVSQPDVVVTLTTPPLLSIVGSLLRAFRGGKHFIWEMDMYPDVAVDLQYISSGGALDRLLGAVADFSRKKADGILALGQCMQQRLIDRGVPASKIAIAENWADSQVILPSAWPASSDPFTVLYSGNLGLAHDVSTIFAVMRELRNDPQFRFVFAGSGARRTKLERLCHDEQISNVEFRSYSSKASLGESLGQGHVGLITQQTSCLGSVVPSKVYGLLAAGRPVLFIGPKESTVARIIARHHCGWQVDCGDSKTLGLLLEHLNQNRSMVEAAGERGRQALLAYYDLPHGVSNVCSLIGAGSRDDSSAGRPGLNPVTLSKTDKRFAY